MDIFFELHHDLPREAPLDEAQQEIDLYRQYANWYGYVCYVMQIA